MTNQVHHMQLIFMDMTVNLIMNHHTHIVLPILQVFHPYLISLLITKSMLFCSDKDRFASPLKWCR